MSWRVRIVDKGTTWATNVPCERCKKPFGVGDPVVIWRGEPWDTVYCTACGEQEMLGSIKDIQEEINKLPAKLF